MSDAILNTINNNSYKYWNVDESILHLQFYIYMSHVLHLDESKWILDIYIERKFQTIYTHNIDKDLF